MCKVWQRARHEVISWQKPQGSCVQGNAERSAHIYRSVLHLSSMQHLVTKTTNDEVDSRDQSDNDSTDGDRKDGERSSASDSDSG